MLRLSQSTIKRWWSVRSEEYCGERFRRVDLNREFEEKASDPMKYGQWFEYCATGQCLRDGSIPERLLTKTKKPTAKTITVESQAVRFKQLVKSKGIKIIETGTVLEHVDDVYDFRLKGVLDVLADIDGERVILDLKSSGLLSNVWEKFGFDKSTFNMRSNHTIQVIAYKYLAEKVWGIRDIPFYYAIHSSTNDTDSFYWRVDVADFDVAMSHFEDTIMGVVDEIKLSIDLGFTPYPSVKGCLKCPIEDCVHRIDVPNLEVLTIDGILE